MSGNDSLVDPAFEYDAPQFVDFSAPVEDDENVDEYFNFDHELGQPLIPDEIEDAENLDEDLAVYKTPKQSFGKATPTSSRRRTTVQVGTPTEDNQTAKPRRRSAPSTPKVVGLPQRVLTPKSRKEAPKPQRVLTPKNNKDHPKPQRVLTAKAASPQVKRIKTPKDASKRRSGLEHCLQEEKKVQKSSSICSSLEEWKQKTAKQNDSINKTNEDKKTANKTSNLLKPKYSHRRSVPNVIVDTSLKTNSDVARKSRKSSSGSVERVTRSMSKDRNKPLSTSLKRSTSSASTLGRARTRSRNASVNRSVDSLQRSRTRSGADKDVSQLGKTGIPLIKPKLTMPSTPTFMKRKLVKEQPKELKSTEERELERIGQLRKELDEKRKKAQESYHTAIKSSGYIPPQSKQPVTRPDKIQFATDERLRNPTNDAMKPEDTEKTFVKMLRQTRSSAANQPLKATIPQPFHLHDRKRKVDDTQAVSKFMSMAEVENSVFGKTPDRFRSRPKNRGPSPAKKRKPSGDTEPQLCLTIPKTPALQTRNRKRDHHIISQSELDEMELEEIQKHQFKAHPVNEKILKTAHLGVKKVPPKEITKPVGFDLETDKRTEVWSSHKQDEEEPEPFHARPVPAAILKGPTGIKPPKEIPPTVPESPAFALKNRVRPQRKPSLPQPEDVKKLIKEHKVPHTGIVFQPKYEHRVTEPQPFSFESRDKKLMSEKEKKIRKALEEDHKSREFHANPMPDMSPERLPRRRTRSLTRPQPFHFEVDDRGAKKAEEWHQKLQENFQKEREMSHFKAHPAEVIHKQPFLPKRSTKPLTDVTEIEFNTDKRLEERAEFEKWKKEHEQELALQKLAAENAEREREEQLYRQFRAEAQVRANPIRKYKGVHIQPSDKVLTRPVTPRFSRRTRSRTLNETQ